MTLAQSQSIASSGVALGAEAAVWAEVYQPQVYLAVWQRNLNATLHAAAAALIQRMPYLSLRASGTVPALVEELQQRLPAGPEMAALVADIGHLLGLMMELFAPQALGMRLEVADRASCPRFHVDRLGVRLVCTYAGPATQWLEHEAVDRSWLGPRDAGLQDEDCGLIRPGHTIAQATAGDALLLKGEGWNENSGRGVVHRSPLVQPGQKRLVLTVDPAGT